MKSSAPSPAGRGLAASWSLLAAAAVLMLIGTQGGPAAAPPPQPAPRQAGHAAPDSTAPALPPSEPTRVRVPSIGVDAPLTPLALDADGRLAAPAPNRPELAGWYADGTSPGAVGTAIVAGHVDTATGPAVFYGLGALRPGAALAIDRADGRTAHFTVDSVEVYPADDFPDDRVYGTAARPELRLITCGGGFDKKKGRYRGNVVVFAHLI